MLTRRIIVCLDVKGGRVVKGVQFTSLRDVGDPVELAERYEREGADEIVFLDISASAEERATLLDVARRTAERLFVPLTIGGGVRSVEDVGRALRAGADKVSINTAAIERPALLTEAAHRFGSQCVVASIDARGEGRGERGKGATVRVPSAVPFADARRGGAPPPGQYHRGSESQHRFGAEFIEEAPSPEDDAFGWIVYTHGGQRATALDAVAWARECVRRGAGEILLTSIDRDGARAGYDLELTRAVSSAVAVPVIASGGAGRPEHVRDVLVDGGADAALVAGILHDGLTTVRAIKQIVRESGLPVRSIE